jgi:hypothetical protein
MGIGRDIDQMIESEIESQVEKAIERVDINGVIQEAVNGYDWSDVITRDLIESNVCLESMVQEAIDEKVESKVNQLLDSTPICDIMEKLKGIEDQYMKLDFDFRVLLARVENLENRELIKSKSGLFSRLRRFFTGW